MRRLEDPELLAYDVLDPDLAKKVRILQVPVLPRGADGMTIGSWIFLKDDRDRSGDRQLLAHELVHVKQYVVGDLSMRSKGMYWKGELTKIDNMMEYFKSPWEIEAYGLERYLWLNFIDFWKSNVEEHLEEKE